jgi:hypothetical protein
MRHFTKLFATMIVLVTVLETFLAGFDAAKHQYGDLAYQAILAVLWIVVGALVLHSERRTDKDIAKMHASFKKLMDDLVESMPNKTEPENPKAKELLGVAQALVKQYNLGPQKQPTINEIEAIEIEFHELTDAYMRMTPRQNGLDVQIKDKPFPPRVSTKRPTKRPTPMKPLAKKAAKKIAVKKGK